MVHNLSPVVARGGVCHSGILQGTRRCRERVLSVPSQRAAGVPTDTRRPLRRALRGEIFRTFGVLLSPGIKYILPESLL